MVGSSALWPAFFVLIFAAAVSGFVNAKAVSESYWTTAQNPQVIIEKESYNLPRNAGRHCTYQDFDISIKVGSFPTRYGNVVKNECATETAFGKVSEGQILQFNKDPASYVMATPVTSQVVEVPGAESFFYTTNGGMFAIDNPVSAFEVLDRVNDYEKVYNVKYGVTAMSYC